MEGTKIVSISKILLIALAYRGILLVYSAIHDAVFDLQFTDIDYTIFTRAAQFVYNGQSPYMQSTYRYTPLLSYLLLPNVWIPCFGKVLFIFADIAVAVLIYLILNFENREISRIKSMLMLWLLMPLNTIISVRGNADSIPAMLTLLCIYLLYSRKYLLAGFVFGLSVHFKFYPIIYSFTMLLYIRPHTPPIKNPVLTDYIKGIFTKDRFIFAFTAGITMLSFTGLFYAIYGYQFLYETLIYHIIRVDNRHNISPYFYFMYLFYGTKYTKIGSILAFLPQVFSLFIGLLISRDLPFALFVQTTIFVIFNKVWTLQYFTWYFSIGCLIFNRSGLAKKPQRMLWMGILYAIMWAGWGYYAYQLEMNGENTFMMVCLYGIGFFWIHLVILANIIRQHEYRDIFQDLKQIYNK